MTESACFLPLGGDRLFTFLHRPDGPIRGGAVLCAPLAEEKLWSHRVLVSFARELAARGWAVLRFDFRGEGDSDRRFEDSDLETRIEDTLAAVDELRRRAPGVTNITLVGLRLGATIAAAAAGRRDDVGRLALWDPVVDGTDYMQSVLRTNLMAQMAIHRKVIEDRDALAARLQRGETVNIEGYELGSPLFSQVSALKLQDLLQSRPLPTQIVAIAPRQAPVRPELASLAAAMPSVTLESALEEPFWKEIKAFCQRAGDLTRVTFAWLGVAA